MGYRPTTPAKRPMSAVTNIATAPPIITRTAALPAGAPPMRPPMMPSRAREARPATAIIATRTDVGAIVATTSGIAAAPAKLAAETAPA